MDSLYQIVDYMADLRNSFHVRFVFGVLTTYEKWKILWFEDTNIAAAETSRTQFDELCQGGAANDYSIGSGNITVYQSRVFDYSEVDLVETLVSLMYRISMTPIASPQNFIEPHKMYIRATKNSFTYESLPSSINAFSYRMPDSRCRIFHVLLYYHRGGDGRIALCCSSTGNLCVIKFLLNSDNEETHVKTEADLWNRLWGTQCRVIKLRGRFALLMPFCYHVRMISQLPTFCGLQNWNRRGASLSSTLNDHEVIEFHKLDHGKLSLYQKDPLLAAKAALGTMLENHVKHDDLKWEHVALMPKFSSTSDTVDLVPVLLDLTRITQGTVSTAWSEQCISQLKNELQESE